MPPTEGGVGASPLTSTPYSPLPAESKDVPSEGLVGAAMPADDTSTNAVPNNSTPTSAMDTPSVAPMRFKKFFWLIVLWSKHGCSDCLNNKACKRVRRRRNDKADDGMKQKLLCRLHFAGFTMGKHPFVARIDDQYQKNDPQEPHDPANQNANLVGKARLRAASDKAAFHASVIQLSHYRIFHCRF